MQYQVKQQFGRNPENQMAEFSNLNDAKKFMFEKLSSDAIYKVNAVYRIYHFGEDMLEEWDQQKWQKTVDQQASQSSDNSSSAGAQSKSNFRPTPLPTSPRPSGMPASSFAKENDADNGKKDK